MYQNHIRSTVSDGVSPSPKVGEGGGAGLAPLNPPLSEIDNDNRK